MNSLWLFLTPKSKIHSKFIKEQEVLTNGTIDGAQHQKGKNWLDRQNRGLLRNTMDLILEKSKMYIFTRVNLLYTLCYEIPCKGQLNSAHRFFQNPNQRLHCPGSLLEGRAEISVIFGWDFRRN